MRQFALFVVQTAAIISVYVYYGILQEKLLSSKAEGGKFHYTSLMLLIQCCVSVVVASAVACVLRFLRPLRGSCDASETNHATTNGKPAESSKEKLPKGQQGLMSMWSWECQSNVAIISVSYLGAMWCSNEAVRYVSYPMQVLGKSCKMIPVMLGQVFVGGKQHPFHKYVCVVLMVVGVLWFRLEQTAFVAAAPGVLVWETVYGMSLLFLSLLCDAFTGPRQEVMFSRSNLSSLELMASQNVWAALVSVAAMVVRGQSFDAVSYVAAHPEKLRDMAVLGTCGAVGQVFIFWMVESFDSLLLTMSTTLRKILSVFFSIYVYGHSVSVKQFLAMGLVFGSILYDKVLARFIHTAPKTAPKPLEKKVPSPADPNSGGKVRRQRPETVRRRAVQ